MPATPEDQSHQLLNALLGVDYAPSFYTERSEHGKTAFEHLRQHRYSLIPKEYASQYAGGKRRPKRTGGDAIDGLLKLNQALFQLGSTEAPLGLQDLLSLAEVTHEMLILDPEVVNKVKTAQELNHARLSGKSLRQSEVSRLIGYVQMGDDFDPAVITCPFLRPIAQAYLQRWATFPDDVTFTPPPSSPPPIGAAAILGVYQKEDIRRLMKEVETLRAEKELALAQIIAMIATAEQDQVSASAADLKSLEDLSQALAEAQQHDRVMRQCLQRFHEEQKRADDLQNLVDHLTHAS